MQLSDYLEALFGPGFQPEDLARLYVYHWAAMVVLPWLFVLPYLVYVALSLPMRRKERAALFLDLLEQGIDEGKSAEQTVISLGDCREPLFNPWAKLISAALRGGETLDQALRLYPEFLSPSITAQLRIGLQTGEVDRVLPACRRLLKDARSQVIAGLHYFLLLSFGLVPLCLFVTYTIQVWVWPKLRDMSVDLGDWTAPGPEIGSYPIQPLVVLQLGLLLVVLLLVVQYLLPSELCRCLRWRGLPIWDLLTDRLPWVRRRRERDFASAFAVLVDAGVPEQVAILSAAECVGSVPFERRAEAVTRELERGTSLAVALRPLDRGGEFQWRLQNAMASSQGFGTALEGWILRLDGLAFQQQQAWTQLAIAGLLILNGASIGVIAYTIFGLLIRLMDTALLW